MNKKNKKSTHVHEKKYKEKKCEYCENIGLMGVGDSPVGSGADENAFDKISESECPKCQRLLI